MIDTVKLKIFKGIMITIGILIIFFIGLGFGQIGKNENQNTAVTTTKLKKVKEGSRLTEDWVKQFLVVYYTKKDLEENRSRYKPYMTEGLYQGVIAEEETAKHQAYKGFKVNYEFQSANIFINQTTQQVICEITFTNDLLKAKDNTTNAQKSISHHMTLQLDYTDQDGIYLINQISPIDITVDEEGTIVPDDTDDMVSTQDE
ncbi:TPA: hypothetical protein VBB01_000644 [Streptococcus agalactiae]|nr:hypothetical protein [Streptococcus agalactiae]